MARRSGKFRAQKLSVHVRSRQAARDVHGTVLFKKRTTTGLRWARAASSGTVQ